MKIVRFLGGLGNQMFQYAFYKSLASKGINVYADLTHFNSYKLHNGFELHRIFGLSLKKPRNFILELLKPNQTNWLYRKMKRVLGLKRSYKEERREFAYDKDVFLKGNHYLWGYWQNEAYFRDIREVLLQDFNFPPLTDKLNKIELENILQTNSVSVHVRRGDYLTEPNLGNICTADYYNSAVAHMKAKLENPKFFVFSDDIIWCKTYLFKGENATFIGWNTGLNSYIDMQLMSRCKHNIIANSSFSWWGAWLNKNPHKIVISPSKWINNTTLTLALEDWIKL